ncbi:exo-alpha-sialidase [Planctomycetales bacterium ZRK34]|nr:exo-alpha-sialidase [Planctomycetales bacterium ZRK34]
MGADVSAQGVKPLAQDFVVVYRSPSPKDVYTYSPGLLRLPSGRLIATIDLGGIGVDKLPGPKGRRPRDRWDHQGKVFISDDRGKTWKHTADLTIFHCTPFVVGDDVYILGHAGDLKITRSTDGGETWSKPAALTEGQIWTGHAHNVVYANGCVYVPMEHYTSGRIDWSTLAPVLLRGHVGDDLTKRENWTFASELRFKDAVDLNKLNYIGVPFYNQGMKAGWLEPNVVQLADPDHIWCDPSGRTFHLFLRAHTNGNGYGAVVKVVEQGDEPGTGAMKTTTEQAPSGKEMVYLPMPGGEIKFNIQYDEKTKLYWLLSSQSVDGMVRRDRMPKSRFNKPYDERHRLQLFFSKNAVDWCFAGIVAMTDDPQQARHYATMVIDGDDLLVLARSGDEQAKSAHDGNIITFHVVKNFRDLVY